MTLLGLDLRDAHTTIAVLVGEDGTVIARGSCEGRDPASGARTVLDPAHRPDAVGVATSDAGVTASRIAAALGTEGAVAIVSPGAALALGEQWAGAARNSRLVVGLALEESVSAGVVVDGRLFGGAHGMAGAAGWLALNPVEREDYRKLGCLEAEVGGPGIVRRLVWRIKSGDRSRAVDLAGGNLNAITAAIVFEAARSGDGVAISVVRDTAKYIGMAVANVVAILDPEVVVLGGAIAEAGDLLLEPARTEMARRVPPAVLPHVALVTASLGDAGPAVGAARAAMLAPR